MKKIFIDGSSGTTGLVIQNRIKEFKNIELITLDENKKKDIKYRQEAINQSDITILCLPDDAARQSVELCQNESTIILDTSTAHRCENGWLYGMPEIYSEYEKLLKSSKRIAVPGCHASGFIALVSPLVKSGILPTNALLTCHSITGYSGGGKKMIADYESKSRNDELSSPRQYAISANHKHLKEMKAITGLENEPIFCPIVADYFSGMLVNMPIFKSQLNAGFGLKDIKQCLQTFYSNGGNIAYSNDISHDGFIASNSLSGSDKMLVCVLGNEDKILLFAQYDNLGKGACGAAMQNLKLILQYT